MRLHTGRRETPGRPISAPASATNRRCRPPLTTPLSSTSTGASTDHVRSTTWWRGVGGGGCIRRSQGQESGARPVWQQPVLRVSVRQTAHMRPWSVVSPQLFDQVRASPLRLRLVCQASTEVAPRLTIHKYNAHCRCAYTAFPPLRPPGPGAGRRRWPATPGRPLQPPPEAGGSAAQGAWGLLSVCWWVEREAEAQRTCVHTRRLPCCPLRHQCPPHRLASSGASIGSTLSAC